MLLCPRPEKWAYDRTQTPDASRHCFEAAQQYPELKLKHMACAKGMKPAMNFKNRKLYYACDMYNDKTGLILPEYDHCEKSLDASDCKEACAGYANQPACMKK
jgi:hypothetical protein